MIIRPLILRWSDGLMRYGLPTKLVILVCFGLGAGSITMEWRLPGVHSVVMATENWDADSSPGIDEPRSTGSGPRLREGTRLASSVGRFSRSGRRWLFEQDSAQAEPSDKPAAEAQSAAAVNPATQLLPPVRFRVLENLALQRVANSIVQDPSDVRWSVSGVITEFDGENWLLLSTVYRAPGGPTLSPVP